MTRNHRPLPTLIFSLLLAFMAFCTGPALARPVFEKPIYNPESKSYFELIENRQLELEGPFWHQARDFAAQKYFKGVQGRLAIIATAQTEMFIKTELRPSESVWFGLYFDCQAKNLKWVTGEELKPGAYSNWDPIHWNHAYNGLFCPEGTPYMPAFIAMEKNTRYWALILRDKRFYQYLIEYPTGGVEPVKSALKPASDAASAATTAPATAAAIVNKPASATDHNGQNEE
jgi:hypothetical protein